MWEYDSRTYDKRWKLMFRVPKVCHSAFPTRLIRWGKQTVLQNRSSGRLDTLVQKMADPKTAKHYRGYVVSIEDTHASQRSRKRKWNLNWGVRRGLCCCGR